MCVCVSPVSDCFRPSNTDAPFLQSIISLKDIDCMVIIPTWPMRVCPYVTCQLRVCAVGVRFSILLPFFLFQNDYSFIRIEQYKVSKPCIHSTHSVRELDSSVTKESQLKVSGLFQTVFIRFA